MIVVLTYLIAVGGFEHIVAGEHGGVHARFRRAATAADMLFASSCLSLSATCSAEPLCCGAVVIRR